MDLFTLFFFLVSLVGTSLAANTVTFVSQDGIDRTIIFTTNPGHAQLPPLLVPGYRNRTQWFPQGWQGNFFAIAKGAPHQPGMLGEFAFNGYAGHTYFDVSAIVNPKDVNGVKLIYPVNAERPVSGCLSYRKGCDNAYYLPDDPQTKATTLSHFVCTLGGSAEVGNQAIRPPKGLYDHRKGQRQRQHKPRQRNARLRKVFERKFGPLYRLLAGGNI